MLKYNYSKLKFNKNGFSIPEMIIAILILGILLVYTFSIFTTEMGSISRTRDFSAAVLVAQETIEAIRNFPFEKLDDEDAGNQSLEAYLNGKANSPQYPHVVKIGKIDFERNVKITNVSGASGSLPLNLKAVEVEIKWKSEDNKNLVYKVATCVTKMQ